MNRRYCAAHGRSFEVVETFEEGTTERHPERLIVALLDCGHSVSYVAADQSDRSM